MTSKKQQEAKKPTSHPQLEDGVHSCIHSEPGMRFTVKIVVITPTNKLNRDSPARTLGHFTRPVQNAVFQIDQQHCDSQQPDKHYYNCGIAYKFLQRTTLN